MRYVRDMALKEDACRVSKGFLPRVMAAFANLAVSVLRPLDYQNVQWAMSNFKLRPHTGTGTPSRARQRPQGPGGPVPAPRSTCGRKFPSVTEVKKLAHKPSHR